MNYLQSNLFSLKEQINLDILPKIKKETITKKGDLYILGKHRLLCGDATNIQNIKKLMNDKKADVVYTDPPYGINLNCDYTMLKSTKQFSLDKNMHHGGNKYNNIINDNNESRKKLVDAIFVNFNYCKEIFLWGADYYTEHIPNINNGSWIVWDKRLDESLDKAIGSCFELCWSKNKHKREIARIKWCGFFGTEKEHDKKRIHPTQKPTLLAEYFLKKWAKDLKIVVDLYAGSGSTLIAAERYNKSAYIMEIEPKYCDLIVQRWQNFTRKKAVLGGL